MLYLQEALNYLTKQINNVIKQVNCLKSTVDSSVVTNLMEGAVTQTTVDVASSTGSSATLVSASTIRAGVLSKAKFDEIVANSIHSGLLLSNPHNVTKDDVGLGNVLNVDTTNASNITTGTLPNSVVPPIAMTTVQVANSDAAMLALTTEEGDVVVRSDLNTSYIRNGGTTGTMADFTELLSPISGVISVNGMTGIVVIPTANASTDGLLPTTKWAEIVANSLKISFNTDQNSQLFTTGSPIFVGTTIEVLYLKGSVSGQAIIQTPPVAGTPTLTLPTSSDTLVGLATTDTLTNKRIEPRVGTVVSSAVPTINTDNYDAYSITALAVDITSMTTNLSGTPTDFQKLTIRIKDDGAAIRAITWGTGFEAKGMDLPLTTVLSKVLTIGFIYDSVTSKWGCVASLIEA